MSGQYIYSMEQVIENLVSYDGYWYSSEYGKGNLIGYDSYIEHINPKCIGEKWKRVVRVIDQKEFLALSGKIDQKLERLLTSDLEAMKSYVEMLLEKKYNESEEV